MAKRKKEKQVKNIIVISFLLIVILSVMLALYSFSTVSYPKIISASVYPEKVTAGQTMLIKAEIKDSLIIKNVKASIETDDLPDITRLLLIDGSIRNGKYERVWIVHDTSAQKWYNITITATNLFGKTVTKIIPYQDPTQSHNASEIVGGTFTGNYSFAGGDINIGGNLNVSGDFYVNSTNASLFVNSTSGAVTNPRQPAFLVQPTSIQTDITGTVTVIFGTEVFDQANNFASNTFTAPVTGKYQLSGSLYLLNIDSAAASYQEVLVTSNRNYIIGDDSQLVLSADGTLVLSFSVLADMDAGDTAYITIAQAGGTQQTDIHSVSYFSGYLVA